MRTVPATRLDPEQDDERAHKKAITDNGAIHTTSKLVI
jgi:hypothetical protein